MQCLPFSVHYVMSHIFERSCKFTWPQSVRSISRAIPYVKNCEFRSTRQKHILSDIFSLTQCLPGWSGEHEHVMMQNDSEWFKSRRRWKSSFTSSLTAGCQSDYSIVYHISNWENSNWGVTDTELFSMYNVDSTSLTHSISVTNYILNIKSRWFGNSTQSYRKMISKFF